MNFFSQVIHADYGRFFQNIKEVSKKEHRSSVILTLDVAVSTLVFGSALTDYFNYEFYKRSYKERKKYAVVKTQDKFYTLVNDPKYKKNFPSSLIFCGNLQNITAGNGFTPMGIIMKPIPLFWTGTIPLWSSPLTAWAEEGSLRLL